MPHPNRHRSHPPTDYSADYIAYRSQLMARRNALLDECEAMQARGWTDETRALADQKIAEVEEINRKLHAQDDHNQRADEDTAKPIRNMSPDPYMGVDESTRAMSEALAARFGGPAPSATAREFMSYRVVDIARHCLEQRGVHTRLMTPNMIIGRALHTTSDFSGLLTETGNRLLRNGYESYQGGVRRICRESSAPDFRSKTKLMLGEAPELLKVLDGGEVKRGTMKEAKESYKLETFARIFGISRQALVNDDLQAFADLSTRLGRAAAEFIASQLVTLLTSNPTMDDGVVLFHATHGNVGSAAVISVTSLGEALKLMRLQKGLDGKTPIDATPRVTDAGLSRHGRLSS